VAQLRAILAELDLLMAIVALNADGPS